MAISFAPKALVVGEQTPTPDDVYNHGFTDSEVDEIEIRYYAIFKRDLALEPTTLDEFKITIVPWLRIHRTKTFNLFPDKPEKVKRVPKEKVAKVPRVKKEKVVKEKVVKKVRSAEDIAQDLEDIICGTLHFRQCKGVILTPEEAQQLEEYRSRVNAG